MTKTCSKLNIILLAIGRICLHFISVSMQGTIKHKLFINVFYSCTKNANTFCSILNFSLLCIWIAMFMTMALCSVGPICVSLLRMVYKWQSSYAYCISFVCFYKTRWTVQTEGGGDTAALVIWNLQWPVLIKIILFVEGSRIYTGFKTNLDTVFQTVMIGSEVNEAISNAMVI